MKAGGEKTKAFMQAKVLGTNEEDDYVWQKVKNVPKLSKPLAIFCCFINIIIPGTGTITAACATDEEKVSKT